MQTKLTGLLRSLTASASSVWLWSQIKLERTTRKVYLMEKAAAFRDDYRRCRHFAFVYYDEFSHSAQVRRDYLTQAKLHKKDMLRARQKLAAAEAIFSPNEKMLMLIATVTAALVGTAIIILH